MSSTESKFRFNGYQILKSLIEIRDPRGISDNLDISFKKSSGINESERKYKLELEVSIEDENKLLVIKILCNGFFEFEKDITDEERHIFFNTSAPAILFPYIRAYISTLTSLSGIKPLILPTINLSKGAVKR
ncbi:protein-export chaperone SecB [Dysgonomonas macrotermitis]|uniref:Preprotein translocase subunit SecB n=1 Tax=Dysgonomonas macrotermitis TaxID=1346286 RepID=A0A1M5JSK0_9BACT|nr:protein-export chaperone SecB [Dysgonomonas macrotermitis]SHG43531.1 preprotein translocase subunit SecB [Dysgonomonas macrotermitis]